MRKIEQQMCSAISNSKCWQSGNTSVNTVDDISKVYLHGNLIAIVESESVTIMHAGWKTNTTKSRLNALCESFCMPGEGVYQSDYVWYVRKFVGKENGEGVYESIDFNDGYYQFTNDNELLNMTMPVTP